MCICEFIIAIVGVTVGNINPVTQAVNLPAQKVLIAFACMCVYLFFLSNFIIPDAYIFWFSFLSLSSRRYLCIFSMTWGPVVWVVTGEIFVSFSHLINILLIPLIFFFTASRHPSQRNVIICRKQLVMELWYRLRNSIPHRCKLYWSKRNPSCQLGC
jgi:hypothetical protein